LGCQINISKTQEIISRRKFMKRFYTLTILMLVVLFTGACVAAGGEVVSDEASSDAGAVASDGNAAEAGSESGAMTSESEAMAVEGEPYVNHLFTTIADYEAATGKTISSFNESPMLAALVSSGDLPPVEERLPKDVAVVRPRDEIGQYGGQLRVIGFYEGAGAYSGLTESMQATYMIMDPNYTSLQPNTVKGMTLSDDGLSLTLFLREGLKWSDGDDFNAKDIDFWYNDLLQNPELTPNISDSFKPGGELMGLNVIDDYTVEFTFSTPYYRAPDVFSTGGSGDFYSPEHFVKQYMPDYSEGAEALVEAEGYETWQQAVQFHAGTADDYYDRDTLAPTLNPWIIKDIGADSVLWERNPYYWRVDIAGNQLPYVDSILVIMTDNVNNTAPVKSLAGELDLNEVGLAIDDFPVFKKGEEAGNYKTYLWDRLDQSHAMGFALNYAHPDPVLREIFNDIRFRQALSLAINREEIAENVFQGLVEPFTAPVSPVWTGYEDWMGTYFAEYDVDRANALLDDMGLEWDADHKWRLRPDGERLTILGQWQTEWLAYSEDLLDLVALHWEQIGVDFPRKFVPEDVLQTAFVANETDIGISNSDGGAESLARSAYPIRLIPPWHWGSTGCCPMAAYPWRRWLDTDGAEGIEPTEDIKRAWDLTQQWLNTPNTSPEYETLINEVIKINVEGLYYFGTVSSPPYVWIIHNRIGNIPREDGQSGSWGSKPYLHETFFIRQ
jgi:peptide/nickel transport system substrate-binding protein